jgi:hypothetical protein
MSTISALQTQLLQSSKEMMLVIAVWAKSHAVSTAPNRKKHAETFQEGIEDPLKITQTSQGE